MQVWKLFFGHCVYKPASTSTQTRLFFKRSVLLCIGNSSLALRVAFFATFATFRHALQPSALDCCGELGTCVH